MNRKITALLIVLIFSICCLSIAFAQNNATREAVGSAENVEIEDMSNYILPISISNNKIEFDDGFVGFGIDSTKNVPKTDDKFSQATFAHDKTENYVKLAIIEAYKQRNEKDIDKIISKIVENDMDKNNEVIKEVLNSNEKIDDKAVVNITNTTEATFTFELLKSENENTSDCLAYKVSLKTIEPNEDTPQSTDAGNNTPDNNTNNNTNNTPKENTDKTANNNATKENTKSKTSQSKTNTEPEKNKTLVNKTTTVINIENNTTIVHNNVKHVNNTTPENNTPFDLMKTAGNPRFILVVVVAIALIAVVIMKRKE